MLRFCSTIEPTPRRARRAVWLACGLCLWSPVAAAQVANTPVHPPAGINMRPRAAVNPRPGDDEIHVVWERRERGRGEVMYAKSTDGGKTFAAPVAVSNDAEGDQSNPDVAVLPSGDVLIVWEDRRAVARARTPLDGDADIFAALITRAGTPTPVLVNRDVRAGHQVRPRVAVCPEGQPFVVWSDSRRSNADDRGVRWDVRAARSDDFGASFGASVAVRPDGTAWALDPTVRCTAPRATPRDARLHVAYVNRSSSGAHDVRVVTSTDAGATFGPEVQVSPSSLGDQMRPELAITTEGVLWVSWHDSRDAPARTVPALPTATRYWEVYAAPSEDFGTRFGAAVPLADQSTGTRRNACIAGGLTKLVGAWADARVAANYDVFAASERPDTRSFGRSFNLVSEGSPREQQFEPACVVSDDQFVVVFTHVRNEDANIRTARVPLSTLGAAP